MHWSTRRKARLGGALWASQVRYQLVLELSLHQADEPLASAGACGRAGSPRSSRRCFPQELVPGTVEKAHAECSAPLKHSSASISGLLPYRV